MVHLSKFAELYKEMGGNLFNAPLQIVKNSRQKNVQIIYMIQKRFLCQPLQTLSTRNPVYPRLLMCEGMTTPVFLVVITWMIISID